MESTDKRAQELLGMKPGEFREAVGFAFIDTEGVFSRDSASADESIDEINHAVQAFRKARGDCGYRIVPRI